MQHAAWSTAALQQQCSMQQWMTLVTCHEDDRWGVEVNRKIDIYLDYLWWLLAHLPSFFMRQVKLDEWEDCIWPAGPITVLTTMLLAALLTNIEFWDIRAYPCRACWRWQLVAAGVAACGGIVLRVTINHVPTFSARPRIIHQASLQ